MNAMWMGLAAASIAAIFAGGALGQTVVGTSDTGNCYPFVCNDSGTSSGQSIDYQQMYASTAFSGITTFDTISFFADSDGGSAFVLSGNYDITFGTTTQALGQNYPIALSNVATFYDGTLAAGSGSGSYSISGAAYTYNPADGNLVMEVVATDQANVPNDSGNGYFEADDSGDVMSRAYLITGESAASDATGLVTGFNAVPEPAAWTLMLAGFAGLGLALRSRRRTALA